MAAWWPREFKNRYKIIRSRFCLVFVGLLARSADCFFRSALPLKRSATLRFFSPDPQDSCRSSISRYWRRLSAASEPIFSAAFPESRAARLGGFLRALSDRVCASFCCVLFFIFLKNEEIVDLFWVQLVGFVYVRLSTIDGRSGRSLLSNQVKVFASCVQTCAGQVCLDRMVIYLYSRKQQFANSTHCQPLCSNDLFTIDSFVSNKIDT